MLTLPCAAQIPQHLEVPKEQLPLSFQCCSERHKQFYRCARTWLAQAGILDKRYIETGGQGKPKHVKTVTTFLNRILGMNLQQQQLVFECGSNHILVPALCPLLFIQACVYGCSCQYGGGFNVWLHEVRIA